MIGEDSTTSSSPTRTGKVPSLWQAAAASAASSGGSSSETKRAAVDGQHGVHGDQALGHGVVALPCRSPVHGGGVLHRHRHLHVRRAGVGPADGDAGPRPSTGSPLAGRSGRPACRPPPWTSSVSAPPAKVNGSLVGDGPSEAQAQRRQVDDLVDAPRPTSTWSVAVDLEGVDAARTRARPAAPAVARRAPRPAVLRLQAADPHRRTAARGRPGRRRHSVRVDQRSEPSASLKARGVSTPHWKRTWFFARRRPVGVEHVALVEDGVGHGSRRREAVVRRGRAVRAGRAHGRSSPGFLEELVEGLVPRGQAPAGLEPLQVVERVAPDADASRCSGK